MSGGPSALGTLLVQRLDAVLGTTMAQHANLLTGARADAVARTAQTERILPAQDATYTDARHSVERVAQHADPRAAVRGSRAHPLAHASGPTTTPTPSAPTQLGSVARLILTLLTQFPEHTPPIVGRQPLWQPPVDARQDAQQDTPQTAPLARALNQTLSTSGMFYESHLADLAFGHRLPAQLRDEPQARLSETPSPPQTGQATQAAPLPGAEAALLVRQQLEVLAYQMFCWQGEAWPGTPMDWEVHRHEDANDDANDDAVNATTQTWSTWLKLDLLNLGEVHAQLTLDGSSLSVRLAAPDCAELLQTHGPALRAGCEAHGLALTGLAVDTWANEP